MKIIQYYIRIFKYILQKAGYNFNLSDGTNNLIYNFVDFLSLFAYCSLSGYNTYKTFDINMSPSYSIFITNILMLIRYYIANVIKINDVKIEYVDKHRNEGISLKNLNVTTSKILNVIEAGSIVISTIFIVTGKIWGIEILGIKSVSIVAVVSVIIIILTGVEGIMNIGVNMFKAEPKIFVERR